MLPGRLFRSSTQWNPMDRNPSSDRKRKVKVSRPKGHAACDRWPGAAGAVCVCVCVWLSLHQRGTKIRGLMRHVGVCAPCVCNEGKWVMEKMCNNETVCVCVCLSLCAMFECVCVCVCVCQTDKTLSQFFSNKLQQARQFQRGGQRPGAARSTSNDLCEGVRVTTSVCCFMDIPADRSLSCLLPFHF